MNPVVVKYGGSLLDDASQQARLLEQIAQACKAGLSFIIVHGGGKEISRRMEKAGLTPRFVNGRRFTDERSMKVVEAALAALNADIIQQLARLGIQGRGLSGRTQHVMEAKALPELGRVGIPTIVNTEGLAALLRMKGLPVFYSVAEDAGHNPLNVNADDFALELAIACHAQELIFLTDTGGILDERGALLETLDTKAVDRLIEKGTIHSGMMVKAQSCLDALRRGVQRVRIGKMLRYANNGLQVEGGTGFLNS